MAEKEPSPDIFIKEEDSRILQAKCTKLLDILQANGGIWPLAERKDLERTAQKILNAANSYVQRSETSYDVAELEKDMEALISPMTKMYDGVFTMHAKDADVQKVVADIKRYGFEDKGAQSHTDIATLYQVGVNVHPMFSKAMQSLSLPGGVELQVGSIKAIYRAIEKMILRKLALDASCLTDVVRAIIRVPKLVGFSAVIECIHASTELVILACKSTLLSPLDGWRDVKLLVACKSDPSSMLCEVQLVLDPLYRSRDELGGHDRYATLRGIKALHQLKHAEDKSGKHPRVIQLERMVELAVAKKDFREAANLQDELSRVESMQAEIMKVSKALGEAVKSKNFRLAADKQDELDALEAKITGMEEVKIASAATASGEVGPHPNYPNLPLKQASAYKYGTMINLEYPGLQLVYMTEVTGNPFFIVPNFLSAQECDRLLAKCSGQLIDSTGGGGATGGGSVPTRSSKHVRVVKSETRGFQERVARLTNHHIANMESVKIMRYTHGQEFGSHVDAMGRSDSDTFEMLNGAAAPSHINRELTLFVYLNDVDHGGETAFYTDYSKSPTRECFLKVKPERGLAVLFYVTLQPPDGVMPPGGTSGVITRNKYSFDRATHHAGLPAIDEKYILSQWIWPKDANMDESLPTNNVRKETRATDGFEV